MIWMAVTSDKYELPIAVADTSRELSEILGVPGDTIRGMKTKKQNGIRIGYKIVTIEEELIEQLYLEDLEIQEEIKKKVDKVVDLYFTGKSFKESLNIVKGGN